MFKDGVVRVNMMDHDEDSFVLKIEKQTATRVYEIELTFAISGSETKITQLSKGGTMIIRLFRTDPSQINEWAQKSE
jgi:hypothetical protein